MTDQTARWGDLKKRGISSFVLVLVGAFEIYIGGVFFLHLVAIIIGVMIWELSRLSARQKQWTHWLLGLLAWGCILVAELYPDLMFQYALFLPVLGILLTPRKDKLLSVLFATMIMVAGHGLYVLRDGTGTIAILWVLGVVIASDILGYFVGRSVGGPKFWPAISPKKTWSGTLAGWVGAAGVGVFYVVQGYAGPSIIALSAIVALAGQMGDILESLIKRRAGVKDASSLIPGHGGVLDRFDAVIGAVVMVMLIDYLMPLPFGL
jgi:phosphatidate cytidylyltransferase